MTDRDKEDELLQLLIDFKLLSYVESRESFFQLRDINIASLMFARQGEYGYTIYYLDTGSTLLIPWKWVDFFKSLDQWQGPRVIDLTASVPTKLSKFIRVMMLLSRFLSYSNTSQGRPEILKCLGELVDLQPSKKLIKELSEKIGIEFESFEYTNQMDTILI